MRVFASLLKVMGMAALVVALVAGLNQSPAMAASPQNQAAQTDILDAAPAQVYASAQQAFGDWSRGELVDADDSALTVTGLSRTNFFKFVDDVSVSLSPVDGDATKTQISIVSVGRMGEYDFGGNQRNIDEYLATVRSLLS